MSFLIAKIIKALIEPANLFSLLFVLGAVASVSHNEHWQVIGRRLCFVLAIVLFLIGFLPVGHWALSPLENRFPTEKPERVDGIILLAGDENPFLTESRKQASAHTSSRRYITFAGLAREFPKAKLAFIGGNPNPASHSALSYADVAKHIMKSVGVAPDHVTFEDKSHNTYENAIMGASLMKPKPDENWMLVTTASHMPRALLTFRKAGWRIFPAPTDYYTARYFPFMIGFSVLRHLQELTTALYEYAGLYYYWALGRIDYPWRRNEKP